MDDDLVVLNACCEGDLDLLNEALLQGADPNVRDSRGRSGLHLAATRGLDAVMGALVAAGAEVNVVDYHGDTPLHCCGHIQTLNILLEYGAQVHARNHHGDTPLILLERRGVEEAVLIHLEKVMEAQSDVSVLPVNRDQGPVPRTRWPRTHGVTYIKSVWDEFCADLGIERLAVLLVLLLCLSLYVAYVVTGIAKRIDMRVPIELNSESYKQEL